MGPSQKAACTVNFSPGVALKPAANIFVQLGPSFNYDENSQQYIRRQTDATATAFGGSRYVLSHLETRVVSLNTRINWTMRPELTLQVFAQPFFASGRYSRFREFAAPRTLEMLDYGTDIGTIAQDPATRVYTVDPDGAAGPAAAFTFGDPNFTSRSLRGTAVLRWEYRPGSTMFFVWTQQRSGVSAFGDYDFARDSRALLGDRVTVVVAAFGQRFRDLIQYRFVDAATPSTTYSIVDGATATWAGAPAGKVPPFQRDAAGSSKSGTRCEYFTSATRTAVLQTARPASPSSCC